MRRYLIVGGAGFAGSALAWALLERGDSVTVCDVVSPLSAHRLSGVIGHPALNYRWKSIHDFNGEDTKGFDTVFHLAGQTDVPLAHSSPKWTVYQNVDGTLAFLEACRAGRPEKILYAGSGWDYGGLVSSMGEASGAAAHNPYAFSKAAAELACWTYHKTYDLPLMLTHVGSNGVIIGPHMRRDVFLFRWLWNLVRRKPIVLEGGNQVRNITYIDDVTKGWLTAADAQPESVVGRKFDMGYGQSFSLKEILQKCFSITGISVSIEERAYRKGEMVNGPHLPDYKVERIAGFRPLIDPDEAIRRTWEWVKSLS